MGDSKLCLLLLLITPSLAVAQDGDQPTCLLAQRYKTLHKYEYRYEAQSLNSINGASLFKGGPMASCKVEIEVPQTCSFIVRTTDCSLSESADMDADGNPIFSPATTSADFAAEMERYPLKVVVEGEYDVKLYPEEGETETILNIKRGIISALAVPLVEEEKNKNMPTIHGMCKTYYTVNAREDIATDITLNRDLSRCDRFVPLRDHTSPLALISGMHYPLAQLIRSSQTCNYKFDNEKKHMTAGSCTEKHILIPFSHKGEYGVTNVGKQELTLVQVSPHNDRIFDRSDIVKDLQMDTVKDKSVVQDKDAGLALLRELAALPESDGDRRAFLFHKLVTMVRGMKTETLSSSIPEALGVSRVLTYQVLAQCGTPECSSAIMQILRSFDSSSLEVDATVFALGMVSNPSDLLINDMLEMAKYKPSKSIMYALSNVVKRFYKAEGKLIPEIFSVANFMAAQLGDCSGDKENTFMTLRVIGNMAPAVLSAGPALRSAVIQCVNQPAASPTVQQAAIQVFRLTPIPDEGREVLMQVVLDNTSPLQKRIAAYLVLMKSPLDSEMQQMVDALANEQDQQFKSFVISHMTNILSSTEPETEELRQRIRDALQGNEIGPTMDPTKFSRNYKMGSLKGNMIFEGTSYLPKELMLEMTLKAFGFDINMMEIGMEGKGFEPTVDALFGENGFFPNTALKSMYFVSDNMPLRVKEILQSIVPALKKDEMKRQNIMRELGRNLNKLVKELRTTESPEAMMYLRLLGNELGYLRTNEMEEMAYSVAMMIDSMFKMFPTEIMKGLMTNADNTIFAHYIFMDNEFFLPTVTGVPLRIALSGTFTPGIKGGLKIARDMSEIAFMPSAGIEFVTQIGSHIPEYVDSGLEMHSSIFHESGLSAKISMGRDQIKLTIPAPASPTKLIKMTNSLVAVIGPNKRALPPMVMDKVDSSECTPFFAGMKYCSALQYTDAFTQENSPYFPFTGDSKFAVELHPTGEVTEYTATVAYALLKEGEDGRQKVDSVNLILRAEGAEPTEARAVMKYNRRKNVITADFQIPDYDVEAGLRLGIVDGNTKGKGTHSISLDLIHKNIPQLSLVGRANLEAMKKGMLQIQLLVPSLSTDATFTAKMKRNDESVMELKSEIKVMETMSEQKLIMKYDSSKIQFDFNSDVNTDTSIFPISDLIDKYGNQLLDLQVAQTDMKVREVFKKFVEAANNYMEMYGADMPYIQNFRLPDMPELTLPETLFMNVETKAVYYFNNGRFNLAIPLPLGGKSTVDLNFPPAFTTPSLSLPEFGLEIVSMEIPVPELVVPKSLTLTIPFFGKAEVFHLMRSNLYNMEASMAVGKDIVDTPSYSAKFDVKGTSPVDILSINFEGSGMIANTDSTKAELKASLAHKFIEASFSIAEDASITDKINVRSVSKIDASSPFGLNIEAVHNGMAGISTQEISTDSNFEGMFRAGPIFGKTISTQSFAIFPFKPEAKMDSSVTIDSTLLKAQNTIAANLANGEFSLLSNTNAFEDVLTHSADLSFKDNKLSLQCNANAMALGLKIRNQAAASAGAGEVVMRVETNADYSENRVYSLLTGSFDANGLVVSSDASVKLLENEATHKASLRMNKDGLTASGKTALQSPLSLENTFNAQLDASRATLSITNNGAIADFRLDNTQDMIVTLSSLNFNSKADVSLSDFTSYDHDITIDLKPFTASANVNNNLKFFDAKFINEAQLQAELYKMDLSGNLKATYDVEEIQHTYQVNYGDMTANAKCNTNGKIFGTQMRQNTELEIIGLAARFSNDARFNSQALRFDHTIRSSIIPFDFNLDAIFNAEGDMTMYGKHSAQLYGKFLLKAQPLAFASSHDCRAAINHKLDNDFSLETTLDNSMDTAVSIEEQKTSFRLHSRMNQHAFNNEMSAYNNAEKLGMEVSSAILTNILNAESEENQKFSLSGYLKYDKHTQSQIIQLPFISNVPMFLESIKGVLVEIAEVVQNFINNAEVRAKLETLRQSVGEFVSEMNIEGMVILPKKYLSDFTQQYVISEEDFDAYLRNLRSSFETMMANISVYVNHFVNMIKDILVSGIFPDTLLQKVQEQVYAFNEAYDIKEIFLYVLDAMTEMIQQIDMEKLKGTSIAFLSDVDQKYDVIRTLKRIVYEIRGIIVNTNITTALNEIKRFYLSLNFRYFIDEMINKFPSKAFNDMLDYIKQQIEYFDIIGKINTFYAMLRDLTVKFEADKKIQAILESVADFVRQLQIEKTIMAAIQMVTDADIPAKFTQAFEDSINYVKTTEVTDMIEQLNMGISAFEQRLKSVDYNDFVVYANGIIAEYTTYLNELITALEIPQKLEAVSNFVNIVTSSAKSSMEQLREIKIAEFINNAKDKINQLVNDDLKNFWESAKQQITNMDIKAQIVSNLEMVSNVYSMVMASVTEYLSIWVELISSMMPEQKIVGEIKQIIDGLIRELQNFEFKTPSFTLPLTDLVVPSLKINMNNLQQIEIPTQLDIPEFRILDLYTMKATTISFNDVKQMLIDFIDFIINYEINMFDVDAFFGDLALNNLPAMPDINLPVIVLPQLSFPEIPAVPLEKLVKSLQVPEIKLPTIPREIMVPCFGKLYGEISFTSPIYTVKTSAEFQNSTETELTPQFTGLLNSQGLSDNIEFLNYRFESTAQIALPKRSRIVIGETLKLNHMAFGFDHQASLSLYGLSGQAQAKTTMKFDTAPYASEFTNTAFIAMEEGMSASLETVYNHAVDLPIINVKGEANMVQKAIVRQEDYTFIVTVENTGKGKYNDEEGNHKSNLQLSLSPTTVELTFIGETDSPVLKMKQRITATSGAMDFMMNLRNEVEAPFIKNSLVVASGQFNLYDMKAELKANHDAELYGELSGVVSNGINFIASPNELVFEFQNKGNAKVSIFESLTAKIDLQNDYSALLRPDSQQMNTVTLARINQYKMFYNFTVANNKNALGVFVGMEGDANLDFLTSPISIPEIDLPFVDFQTPAISDLNLYEQTGLNNLLMTTEQSVDVDAMMVYQKKAGVPILNVMDLIYIPPVGNMISELTFKSAFINLNVNAGLYAEDDLVFRLGATTTSEFESLKAKLDGTASLTTRRGIKLANSLSLENLHIEGTHDSTISMSTESLTTAVSVATMAKIALPILNLEVNQNLVADTKSKANAVSTWNMKGDFNIPVVKAVGKADAEYSLKLEGTFEDVSMESFTRANMDGTMLDDYLMVGILDNELNLYLNKDGLRSTAKFIADTKLNQATTKIIGMDINENIMVEASLSRVYAVYKYTGNNEANLLGLNTNGKHIAQATVELAPTGVLTADIEIDVSQPTNLGDFIINEKTVAEVTTTSLKISSNAKFSSPLYTTNLVIDAEGNVPVIKVVVKSSATSAILFLEYDMDASSTAKLENDVLTVISKAVLAHTDINMEVNDAITQSLSDSRHILNVDITSPTFTDMNLRYACGKDSISASVSTPSTGFLGLQVNSRVASQISARIYGRYPSSPDVDVDLLSIRSSSKDADKMNLQIAYNMEAPKVALSELKTRLPAIISTFTEFADKYQITRNMKMFMNTVFDCIIEAYNAAINYDVQMSQLSIFFRNIIVQYQKTVQVFLDALIKILRETKFTLPGSAEMTTLPEVLKQLTSSVAAMLGRTVQIISANAEVFFNSFIETVNNVKLRMPISDVVSVSQIFDQVKIAIRMFSDELVDFVKNMESLDTMLAKIGETFKAVVEKTQEFVDTVTSDYLDDVLIYFNRLYLNFVTIMKEAAVQISDLNIEQIKKTSEYILDMFIYAVEQFNNAANGFLQQASEEAQAYMKISDGKLEIDLPFTLLK